MGSPHAPHILPRLDLTRLQKSRQSIAAQGFPPFCGRRGCKNNKFLVTGGKCPKNGTECGKPCGKPSKSVANATILGYTGKKTPVRERASASTGKGEKRPLTWESAARYAAVETVNHPQNRDRQARWDLENLITESTKFTRDEDAELRRLCKEAGITRHQLIKCLLREWVKAWNGRKGTVSK